MKATRKSKQVGASGIDKDVISDLSREVGWVLCDPSLPISEGWLVVSAVTRRRATLRKISGGQPAQNCTLHDVFGRSDGGLRRLISKDRTWSGILPRRNSYYDRQSGSWRGITTSAMLFPKAGSIRFGPAKSSKFATFRGFEFLFGSRNRRKQQFDQRLVRPGTFPPSAGAVAGYCIWGAGCHCLPQQPAGPSRNARAHFRGAGVDGS